MPLISLQFIIIGIITDTTGITIIITTGITIIIVIITTSDLALPTRGAYAAYSGDGGQAFHLKADRDSGRSRTAFR